MAALDPRLHAYREDLADLRLKGVVHALRYAPGETKRVIADVAAIRKAPASDASLTSEALRGETVRVFEETAEGWAWGQLETDGYVGYFPSDALSANGAEPTHRITALHAFVYPGPDMKLPARGGLPLSAHVAITGEATTRGTTYALLAGGEGAIIAAQAVPIAAPPEADFVAVAQRFLNAPYLWGGRTSFGLDCSALVQLSLAEAAVSAPRDTDLQERALGTSVAPDARSVHRGDLVFWRGHVGIMLDGEYMLHASGFHASVVIEPLGEAIARIAERGGGAVSSVRRLQ